MEVRLQYDVFAMKFIQHDAIDRPAHCVEMMDHYTTDSLASSTPWTNLRDVMLLADSKAWTGLWPLMQVIHHRRMGQRTTDFG